jgi:hypothetical protein
MVAGIDLWETEWHSLAEEITVVDPIHSDSIVLTIGWIAAGQRLLRVAATEVSAGVYAFAEFRGEPPDCARCVELRETTSYACRRT